MENQANDFSHLDFSKLVGYLAPTGFEADLAAELGDVVFSHDRLMFAPGPKRATAWAQNVWENPVLVPMSSIGEGVKALRAVQRNWWPFAPQHFRRTQFMVEKLPKVSAKPLEFGTPAPTAALGSFTLLAPDQLLFSSQCSSVFPNGEVHFVENKIDPPNRAYLKMWEIVTRLGVGPKPGERCLDLGACPGGWSWVIANLGAQVTAVDKAPLDPKIAAHPLVDCLAQSAFGLEPKDFGRLDWFFSDIICYPERLLRLVEKFRDSGLVRNFVCTIKFQGETDFEALAKFQAIPGSEIIHLYHNKHEVTWVCLDRQTLA